jgi:hypothetical protein
VGVWYISHSKVRGINPATGKPYPTKGTIAAEETQYQNLYANPVKTKYKPENTGPITPTLSELEYYGKEYIAKITERDKCKGIDQNCVIAGGKKSRKSHNSKKSKKSKKSKRSHSYKRSRR